MARRVRREAELPTQLPHAKLVEDVIVALARLLVSQTALLKEVVLNSRATDLAPSLSGEVDFYPLAKARRVVVA